MKIVKTFCGRWLDNYELVFLEVGQKEDGYYAVIDGETPKWSDGPFATFAEAEARLREHAASLGMDTDLSHDVIRVVDCGHRTDEGEIVTIKRAEKPV